MQVGNQQAIFIEVQNTAQELVFTSLNKKK